MVDENLKEDIRIGVFVCHCGTNIGGIIDCKKLAEEVSHFKNVVHVEDNLYTCSETGLTAIKNAIKEYNLNRVVVASCTPRTHEPLFRECINEAGLNPYLFHLVNIRDQCTWVHMFQPDEAYKKAKILIRMGVARVSHLAPLNKIKININPSALVIGGGVAGINCALVLSNLGYKTYLVEKEDKLGGRLNSLYKLFPYNIEANQLLEEFKSKINQAKNLEIFTLSKIKKINGFVGNFQVEIDQNGFIKKINVGAIIVAVGASLLDPKGFFNYNGKNIITQLELESILKEQKFNAKNVVMIQCVGSRNKERPYCSAVCCQTAIKNALNIKELNSNTNIVVLFRDVYAPGTMGEDFYKKAREQGIIFIRYDESKPPIINKNSIKVFNEFLGEDILIPFDLIVLSTPMVANDDNEDLAKLLKVPLEINGFFLEAHVKLRPNDFSTDGIFICGSAKWPISLAEAITQGYSAAARASTILSNKTIEVDGAISSLPEHRKSLCTGCEICVKICPYSAIKKNENDEIEIIEALCKGCGLCGATCKNQAIFMKHFSNEAIIAEILACGGLEE